jgi:hypothetical protein
MNAFLQRGCKRNARAGLTAKHIPSVRDLFLLLLIIALALASACSLSGHKTRTTQNRLNLPECVIVRGAQSEKDLNIEAFKNVLNAVALSWKMITPDELEALGSSGNRLVLIIPLRAAKSLTASQIRNVLSLVEKGALLVSEGVTPLVEKLEFHPGKSMPVRYLQELAYPEIEISWEKEVRVTPLLAPGKAIVLNRERDSGASMVCLLPYGQGGCLLFAAELDPEKGEGYTRFPYFHQELRRAGIDFPFRSERLSAFFDYAYRLSENPEVLARVWRETGIQSLHVGAWDFFDGDKTADDYLRKLIDACHRNGILVYAWLELPHVSEEFWTKHPKWREKTATGRDAHVDWRYLMNLKDPECFDAIAAGLEQLLRRFEWDGVNLGELYFDSPSGAESPEDFTPLNKFVRSDFKLQHGIDPIEFFREGSSYYWKRNAREWNNFVEYRIGLEKALNERFLQLLSGFRNSFIPSLDLIITYVDNIYDPSMREAVGADVNEIFGLLDKHDFTLVLEDPGTVWHLGPRRYAQLAETYSKLTRNTNRLGIDINIVDRDVKAYPTAKQTGAEFLELFYYAGSHFQTVMAYSEQTMQPQDAALVSCALAAGTRGEPVDGGIRIHSPNAVIYRSGAKQAIFSVDGNLWPCTDEGEIHLPAGDHLITIENDERADRPRLIRLNGNLLRANYVGKDSIEFSYIARGRAIAIFSCVPQSVQINKGLPSVVKSDWVMLPAGSHSVRAVF